MSGGSGGPVSGSEASEGAGRQGSSSAAEGDSEGRRGRGSKRRREPSTTSPAQAKPQAQAPQSPLKGRRGGASGGHGHGGQNHRKPGDPNRKRPLGNRDFLLGGNIRDPLNLASISGPSPAGTPTQGSPSGAQAASPAQQPIAVLIPKSHKDPLNLSRGDDEDGAAVATGSQSAAGRTRRKRRRKEDRRDDLASPDPPVESVRSRSDPIVSPVIPRAPPPHLTNPHKAVSSRPNFYQPQANHRNSSGSHQQRRDSYPQRVAHQSGDKPRRAPLLPHPSGSSSRHGGPRRTVIAVKEAADSTTPKDGPRPSTSKDPDAAKPQGEAKDQQKKEEEKSERTKANLERFRYGNYNQYYGTRLPKGAPDPRLQLLRPEWVRGRHVLDIGCNIGHLTCLVARDLGPARCLGVDIDPSLVSVARKNVRHYLAQGGPGGGERAAAPEAVDLSRFPPSFPSEYGPIESVAEPNPAWDFRAVAGGPFPGDGAYWGRFPDNVAFATQNFVLLMDQELERVAEEWDCVLALSVSKWVQLNWGDAGLKRFFRRAFRALRPGGVLVLEPQLFASYKKKMRQYTQTMKAHYHSVALRPADFPAFLLEDVGFASMATLKEASEVKGFERPVYAFFKAPRPTSGHQPVTAGPSTSSPPPPKPQPKRPTHLTFRDDDDDKDEVAKASDDQPTEKRAKKDEEAEKTDSETKEQASKQEAEKEEEPTPHATKRATAEDGAKSPTDDEASQPSAKRSKPL